MFFSSSPDKHMSFSSLRVGVCTNASINPEIKFDGLKLIQRMPINQVKLDEMDYCILMIYITSFCITFFGTII